MRIDNTDRGKKKKKQQYKHAQQGTLEKIIFDTIHKSMKAAIDLAMDDIFKDWKIK